ncbi:hypothetical protein L1987_77874 [Smallanthus sonchifolius]|uniref:Uncharacterized protein n=1 Tax=Smallanthus sonchifolius TaxID=185202 RepID=A0ACB8ZAU5_9ASTR|nr:hypothetical protein L1987_77874 [Smallanthus sonchifolius]
MAGKGIRFLNYSKKKINTNPNSSSPKLNHRRSFPIFLSAAPHLEHRRNRHPPHLKLNAHPALHRRSPPFPSPTSRFTSAIAYAPYDGSYYFDDKHIDVSGHQGPLSATAAVVRGLTTFASTSESLNIHEDKILGLARFFLGIGVPGNSKDLYYQIDSLSHLENNRVSVPLVLSLPATVLSLASKDKLKVKVSTVLGSIAPPLSVKLMQVFSSGSKDASVLKQELHFDPKEAIHMLDALPVGVDIGKYVFAFEIVLSDPEDKRKFATRGRTKVPVHVTGVVKVDDAKVAVLEGDIVESEKKLDLPGKNDLALSANHLQKLHLSFLLTTPFGKPFKPHQALLKLRHETGVEHIFVVENSGRHFEITLDFLGLVEKFFYLSGQYDIELTVGDAVIIRAQGRDSPYLPGSRKTPSSGEHHHGKYPSERSDSRMCEQWDKIEWRKKSECAASNRASADSGDSTFGDSV